MIVTAQEVKRTFKYGARVTPDDGGRTISVVDLEVGEQDGQTFVKGWAYPNKDFYYFVGDGPEVRDNGWVLSNNGARVLLKPLTQADGTQILNMMKDV